MSHGPEHQIEHAEHAVHAAGDDFYRMVTMSIAIVAAFAFYLHTDGPNES